MNWGVSDNYERARQSAVLTDTEQRTESWLCGSFTTAKPFVVEMALNEARVQDGQAQFRIGYTVDNTLFVTVDAASKKG